MDVPTEYGSANPNGFEVDNLYRESKAGESVKANVDEKSGHERYCPSLYPSGGSAGARDGGRDDGGDLQVYGAGSEHGEAEKGVDDGYRYVLCSIAISGS